MLERRELLSSDGFLQGTAYIDSNGNHAIDSADTYLVGATITLYQLTGSNATFLASTTTGADGSYLFQGLAPGDYRLVETPPTGYTNSFTQTLSQTNHVIATTSSSIDVELIDPALLTANVNGTSLNFDNANVTFDGDTFPIGVFELPITLTGPNSFSSTFITYCADLVNSLDQGQNIFPVMGDPSSMSNLGPNAGRIAYLYNTYAANNSLTTAQQVGLQLAIWELEYNQGPHIANGSFLTSDFGPSSTNTVNDFYINSPYPPTTGTQLGDAESAGATYINASYGHSSVVEFLDATVGGTVPTPSDGLQSVLATNSLDFANVPKVTPTINTTQQPATAIVGSSVADTATVSGGNNPSGTVTFALYNNPNATGMPLFTDTETLVNGVATSAGYTATATGTDYWVATYHGDSNNNPVSSPATAEPVNITPATPNITTTPSPTSVTLGTSTVTLKDSAVLAGGYSPTGMITFTLVAPGGATVDTETVTVSGNGTYTTPTGYTLPTSVAVVGTYQWNATFTDSSGNNFNASDINDMSEQVPVTKASPNITTTPSPTSVTLGTSTVTLKDSAVLSGGYSPTGTITFTLVAPGGATVDTETVTVSGNGTYTTPTGYTLPTSVAVVGTYQWNATFTDSSGNNFNASDINDMSEQVPVTKASPNITTTPSPTSVTLGTSTVTLKDSAVLAGGYSPTGTITFTLVAPGGATVDTETVTVSGNGTYTTPTGYTLPTTVAVVGIYQWNATFTDSSGNNFNASDINDTSEQVPVTKASPNITTTPSPTSVTLGTSTVTLKDSAVLSGGYSPTGTITFTLVAPGGATVDTETVTVSGNGTYTTPTGYTLPTSVAVVGTYQWNATFTDSSGNNFNASDINDKSEQVPVTKASPNITTTPSPTSVTLGTTTVTLKDSAVLSGGYSPTGTITFTLVAPGGATVDTETVTVSGNGTYTTPTGYKLPTSVAIVGTYQWNATFTDSSGNNFNASDINDKSEQVPVTKGGPSINTTPGGTVTIGGITISGTKYSDLTGNGFSGDDTPQAGVTINLYQDTNGTGGLQSGDALVATTTTAADGTFSFTPPGPGTYFVQEAVPGGYIQTGGGPNGSAGNTYYTVVVTAGHAYSGYKFDDFQIPTCVPTCVTYTVTHNGCSQTYSDLAGNTHQGDTVKVTFTVTPGMNDTLTLVSYVAPGSSWSDSNAYQQKIYQVATGTFGPGTHSLSVQIPNCYYQIDFICGQAIDQLEPVQNNNAYGPDSAEILYHAENRFLSSDNGGTTSPLGSSLNTQTPQIPAPTVTSGATSSLTDSATLSGGYNPGGTITFYLMPPGSTASTLLTSAVYTDVVTVSGNGTYTTAMGNHPGGYVPTAGGTYQWVAVYSGDGNNASVTSAFGDEPEKVIGQPITICGTKYSDCTGNGFSCDDGGLGGVTMNLYLDANNDGKLTSADGNPVATTTTASDGSYHFTVQTPGIYFVQEAVPSGYIQTGGGPNGTAGSTYYTINAVGGQTYGGNDFDDFKIPTCVPTCVSYTVYNNYCQSTNVSDLRGNTNQGNVVTVTFTVPAGMNDQLSLVSYIAPGPSFDANTAYQQQIYDMATGIFTPGTHTLTVCIPNCYYQIDFICGLPICELGGGPGYGPDGSNIFYSAESRLISADNDGTNPCSTSKGCSVGDFAASSFWSSSCGQTLISKCDGSQYATQLAQWLVTTFPNLYGPGSKCCLVNSNGTYFTNLQVASAYSHCSSANQQPFCTALSIYCTSTNLAGSTATSYARQCGFNISASGCCNDNYNVGSNGAAFGCNNNTTMTVMQLLVNLNMATNCGSDVCSGGTTICGNINKLGNVTNAAMSDEGLGYTPAQVRTAYGVSGLSVDGTGQTIAVVDAYDNPSIFASLDTFDQQFSATTNGLSLYDQYGSASSFLSVVGRDGQASSLPSTDSSGGWETEAALDVEWIHAMAPGAKIILVEANSQSLDDLMSSVKTAASLPGVSVVSMSWGFAEGQSVLAADEAQYDSYLTTPAGHQGVTFVASTGDYGAADPEYPAFSPNVLAVGGTSLYLNGDNSHASETGWGYLSNGLGIAIGGGGGVSLYENEPAFQQGAQSTGYRTTPDVSMIADPATGVWISDTYNLDPSNPWEVAGGTSLSSPAWAALIALADQTRVASGGQTLGTAGSTETQQALYTLPVTDFNAVTTGNNGYSAGPGYNLVGGLGTPIANLLIPDLAAYAGSTAVPAGRIALSSAEATLSSGIFGAANALTGIANAFTIADVEIASTPGLERFLTSSTSNSLASANSDPNAEAAPHGFLDLIGASAMGTGSEEGVVAGAAGATPNASQSSAAPNLSTFSLAAARRLSLRTSGLDGEALDTLFSANGADSASDTLLNSDRVEDGDGWLKGLSASARTASGAETVGRDAGTPQTKAACARCRDSAEPAARAASPSVISPAVWASGPSASADTLSRGMDASVTEDSDQLIEAVDAVAEKSAEAVSQAYESLVDALFGLIG
ncbi:MAG TPA: SdrD B-like domain-containing protein [Pirellulales bacterium]|nr:SdrD B-like domain-containing protein [Pirellulales bacterium]